MKASLPGGHLRPLDNCTITIGVGASSFAIESKTIVLRALPDIDDTKEANYENDEGIGRTQPFLTYKNSGFRKIGLTLHFFVTDESDVAEIWENIRALQSTVYPLEGDPYTPPKICQIKCGNIFFDAANDGICAVCTSVGVKYDTSVAWDENTYLPYKVDVTTSWYVVYKNSDLPGANSILSLGIRSR
jgi:hypothetical protein